MKVISLSLIICFSVVFAGESRPLKQDIGIVISTAVDRHTLDFEVTFLEQLADRWSISLATTRLALVKLEKQPKLAFSFRSFVNRECAIEALHRLRPSSSNLAANSVNDAYEILAGEFKQHRRWDANPLIILILPFDVVLDHGNYEKPVKLRSFETYVFSVGGVPTSYFPTFLASSPADRHVFALEDRNKISDVLRKLPWIESYVQCTKPGLDECNRECQCQNGRFVNCFRVRKEISRLSIEERKRFFAAFHALGTDPAFADAHDRYAHLHEEYTCTKIHKEDHFNPWHRWLVAVMENTLTQFDCRITIPFWDWSYWKEIGDLWSKDVWREEDYDLGGTGWPNKTNCVQTGLFREGNWISPYKPAWDAAVGIEKMMLSRKHCLERKFSDVGIASLTTIDKLLGTPIEQFRDVFNYLRFHVHNVGHLSIGGSMASHRAPGTPEFWMHHCFLDKLWFLWQQRGPDFKTQLHKGMNSSTMFLWPYSQEQIIDTGALPKCVKYTYEDWPKHKLKDFHGLKSYIGSREEKSVCATDEDLDAYLRYVTTLFPDDLKGLSPSMLPEGTHVTSQLHKDTVKKVLAFVRSTSPVVFRLVAGKDAPLEAWLQLENAMRKRADVTQIIRKFFKPEN